VCGCDLVGLSYSLPEIVVIGEMKQSFTLELVLQAALSRERNLAALNLEVPV
jgi:hypothetical protein